MPISPNPIPIVEIRILPQQEAGYPVELTLDHQQQFQGSHLTTDQLPWVNTAAPLADGQRLFEWLFADRPSQQAWAEIRGQSPQRRVRLRIDATAPELHAIPWELLRDASPNLTPQTLAAEANTPFSRYLTGKWPAGQPLTDRPIKLLVAIANPDNLADYRLSPLDVTYEKTLIQEATANLLNQGQIDITYLPQPVTLPALEQALSRGYHWLHVVAHGQLNRKTQTAALFLADANQQVNLVYEQTLAEMIHRQAHKPQLIVLATCQSASRSPADAFRGLAPRLIQTGVPVVLAMQDDLPIKTARAFTATFYGQLLHHGQVDLATNQARSHILTANLSGAAIPVLFMRLPDGVLFEPESVISAGSITDSGNTTINIGSVGRDISGNIAARDINQEIHHHHYVEPAPAPETPRRPFEPETVLIPAGPFWLGDDDDPQASPRHQVELPAYHIGKYPVTNGEYELFLQDDLQEKHRPSSWLSYTAPADKRNQPVVGLTWTMAVAYCDWLTHKTHQVGRSYYLPTEAEWEKAARGTDGRLYPWGDDWQADRCHTDPDSISPVDRYPPQTIYGGYDMVGNAREWTCSLWGTDRRQPADEFRYQPDAGQHDWSPDSPRNNLAANQQMRRVYRGGAAKKIEAMRCSTRQANIPETTLNLKRYGFRVVMRYFDQR